MMMLGLLWLRFKSWIVGAGAIAAGILSVWLAGRRSGATAVATKAAAEEQKARRAGDAAFTDAQRDGASKRMRDGSF